MAARKVAHEDELHPIFPRNSKLTIADDMVGLFRIRQPLARISMVARWQFVFFFTFGIAAAAFGESPAVTSSAHSLETSTEALAAELTALRARVAELERERPSLDMHAFQNECNSSVYCSTKDGNFCANFGGRVELDWLWASADENLESAVGSIEDGIFFRRARLHGAGTLYNIIDYYAEFEFAPVDNIVFQDVWMQLRDVPLLGHIRAGHLKVPFGLENETSACHLTFMERSAVHDAFQQEYDPGIMAWNTAMHDDLRFAAALLRFDPRESGQSFGDGEYSFASRLSGAVWHNEDDTQLFHLGASYRRNEAESNPVTGFSGFRFRARPEIRNTPRLVDTQFFAADHTDFFGLEAAVVWGRFSLQGEYVQALAQDAVVASIVDDRNANGYYVAASYFLTGEHRPYSRANGGFGRIEPNENISPSDGFGMLLDGAWEAKVRYSNVNLSEFEGGTLESMTLGLNWYLIPNSKILVDYILADRPAASNSGRAHLLGIRFNVEF